MVLEDALARTSAHPPRPGVRASLDAAPACVVAGGATIGLVSAQGGYFPASWAWTSAPLLLAVAVWAVAGGRAETGRLDALFAGLLAALTAWIGGSIAWSVAPPLSVLELERALVLVGGVSALLVLARRTHVSRLVGTLALAVSLVSAYSLATRLFPERLGMYDPIAVYRLSEPVGYWNGLGIFTAMGLLLSVGIVAEGSGLLARGLAAASTVVLATTLYFTFSRGAWLALAGGLATIVLLTPRRPALVAATIACGVPAGIAVLVASRSGALTSRVEDLARAADEGRTLAVIVVALCAAAAVAGLLVHVAERRLTMPRLLSTAVAAALVVALAGAATVLFVREGGPASLAERAWSEFEAPPLQERSDLNSRLLSLSGNGRAELWRAAVDVAREHPVLGSGAGTFERLWRERGDSTQRVRDAHGLYVETLAELGPVGLALLLATLAVPLVAAVLARRVRLVPAVAGAYAAYVLHAGADWDWELAGVTLTALLLGTVLVVASRKAPSGLARFPVRAAVAGLFSVASLAATLGGLGNSALAQAQSAVDRRDVERALDEAERARVLMPWSGRPWLARGEAEFAAGDPLAAAESFRRSIEIDERDWRAWLDLAIATEGPQRARALARARRLYPRSTEIARTADILTAG